MYFVIRILIAEKVRCKIRWVINKGTYLLVRVQLLHFALHFRLQTLGTLLHGGCQVDCLPEDAVLGYLHSDHANGDWAGCKTDA